jgi:hypothetical protein
MENQSIKRLIQRAYDVRDFSFRAFLAGNGAFRHPR